MTEGYTGRFAPSPTGLLHAGSLVAALASWLDARTHGGQWLVRIEGVDTPRSVTGADGAILQQLAACGLVPDGPVLWQSQRGVAYAAALQSLVEKGWAYPCGCSRRDVTLVQPSTRQRFGELIYPGTCRGGLARGKTARSVRVRVGNTQITFEDAIQGRVMQALAQDSGDFLLHRADGLFAYQLAVVIDDAEQGVTHVVRGADLLDSTPRQIFLQGLLGYPVPRYAHLPLALNAGGEKLSKQTLAAPLDALRPAANLVAALNFLGQAAPAALIASPVGEVWRWALAHWQLSRIPRRNAVAAGF